MNPVVLLTTAIHPPAGFPFLKMTQPAMRLVTTKASIFNWAAIGIRRLVVADATGTLPLSSADLDLLRQMGTEVEQLSYQQDVDGVLARGKGYGEGQLLKFALEHSTYLRDELAFFKCTGKVYCRNFRPLHAMIREMKVQNLFWMDFGHGFSNQAKVDLRFFCTTRSFCMEHLIPAYLNADDRKMYAEFSCLEVVHRQLKQARALRPLLSGLSGSTGEPYFESSLGDLDVRCPCWVGR